MLGRFAISYWRRSTPAIAEVADDKHALDQSRREEMEAEISATSLMIERSECALIWHAESKGEIYDFSPCHFGPKFARH